MSVSLSYPQTLSFFSLSHTSSVSSVLQYLQCEYSSPSSVYLSAVFVVELHPQTVFFSPVCALLERGCVVLYYKPDWIHLLFSHRHIERLEVIEIPHLAFSFSLSFPSQHVSSALQFSFKPLLFSFVFSLHVTLFLSLSLSLSVLGYMFRNVV